MQKHCCPLGLICPDCFYWNPHVHCIVVTDLGKAKVVYVYFGLLSDRLYGRSWSLLGCWWPVELMQLLNCLTAKVKNALSSMMRCEMSAFIFLITTTTTPTNHLVLFRLPALWVLWHALLSCYVMLNDALHTCSVSCYFDNLIPFIDYSRREDIFIQFNYVLSLLSGRNILILINTLKSCSR